MNRFCPFLWLCLALVICAFAPAGTFAQDDTCTIYALPYVQDFENEELGTLPECWSQICYFNYPCPRVLDEYPHSGTNSLSIPSNTYTYVVLPPVDNSYSIQTLELRLWAYVPTFYVDLSVGIITDGTANSFQTHSSNCVRLTASPENPEYQFLVFYFDWVNRDANQIVICAHGISDVYLDDIELVYEPCSKVSHLEADNSTPGEATLNWHSSVLGTPVGYELYVNDIDHNNTYQIFTQDTFYTMTGLGETSRYEVAVQANCGAYMSDLLDTVSFMTRCFNTEDMMVSYLQMLSNDGEELDFRYPLIYSQQLFLSSELGDVPRTISAIAFKYNRSETTNRIRFYMALVSDTALSYNMLQSTDSVPFKLVSDHDIHWKMDPDNEWFVVYLDSLFEYDGIHNLLLVSYGHCSYVSDYSPFFVYHYAPNLSAGYFNYGDPIDPLHPVSGNCGGTTRTETRFIYCDHNPCVKPGHLEVSELGANSAWVSWDYLEDVEWELALKSEDNSNWMVQTVTQNPFFLSGLHPNTHYSLKVRTNCGDTLSSWSEQCSFTTDCMIDSLPYRQTFDEGTVMLDGSLFVDCWRRLTEQPGSNPYVTNQQYYNYSAPNALTFPVGNFHSIVVLPEIDDNIAIPDLRLSYRWRVYTGSQYLETGLMSDPNDMSTFEPLDTVSYSMGCHTCDFSNYIGSARYVAIRGTIPSWYYTVNYVDDVELDYNIYCPRAVVTNIDNITSTSAQITWDCDTSVHQWVIEYGPSGYQPGTGLQTDAATNPYVLSGLDPATTYDVYVRTLCSEGDTGRHWFPKSFATLECDVEDRCVLTLLPGTVPSSPYSLTRMGEVDVVCNGVVTQHFAVVPTYSYSLEFCDHSDVDIIWHNNEHGGQTSLTVLDSDMDTIVYYPNCSPDLVGDTICSVHIDCFHSECPQPQNIVFSGVTQHEVDVAWTTGGVEQEWLVRYRKMLTQEWKVYHVSSNFLYIDSLVENTWYDVQVKALCGDALESIWCKGIFRTNPCENSCDFTLLMADLYGDGWNGASLDVLVNDSLVRNLTVEESGKDTLAIPFSLCLAEKMKLAWHKGSYDNECFVCLVNAAGDTVYKKNNFSQIQNNQTIFLDTCYIYHHIYASAGEGGSIYPEGDIYVKSGDYIIFSSIPDDGFVVENVYVDGFPVTTQQVFQLSHIVADHTIHAEFMSNGLSQHVPERLGVYPNPTSGRVVLDGETSYDECRVWVIASDGRIMFRTETQRLPVELDLSGYASGIYVLEVIFADGRRVCLRVAKQC